MFSSCIFISLAKNNDPTLRGSAESSAVCNQQRTGSQSQLFSSLTLPSLVVALTELEQMKSIYPPDVFKKKLNNLLAPVFTQYEQLTAHDKKKVKVENDDWKIISDLASRLGFTQVDNLFFFKQVGEESAKSVCNPEVSVVNGVEHI